MTEISIRSLRSADRENWQDLWAQYNAFYGREGDTALPAEIVDTSWNRLLDDNVPVHGLVAERENTLIGLTHFVFHPSLIRIADTCYMQDLFTLKAARGLGVGQRLIAAVGDACVARGVQDIYWHTHSSNETARALYDRVAQNTDFLVYRPQLD
ncbi:MAG: GNAT family N-acetyltransferase [Hyphomicrobiaceae bacterium]|nr:GNAT family N-acetyltransferase [Hyphomicrobiaceae bacterium]